MTAEGDAGAVGAPGGAPDGPRRLGMLGTMVWDTIHRRGGRREPVTEWGGMAYALSAGSAALPEGWEILPIMKVGRDLAEPALRYLKEIPGLWIDPGVVVVDEPNNRVELRYTEAQRRTEHLTGGVPPWSWSELRPVLSLCDALYVNFISGAEMEVETARAIRGEYAGATYADLHSLFLDVGDRGIRVPRTLPHWKAWLQSFDAVQMNEDEFELLGSHVGDPWRLAAEAVGPDLKLVAVTLGPRGAGYVASPAMEPDPLEWPGLRKRIADPGPARSGRMSDGCSFTDGDPTGSGDVWGATFFCRLLDGSDLESAMRGANRAASRNVSHMGAGGLHHHLRGRLAPGDPTP